MIYSKSYRCLSFGHNVCSLYSTGVRTHNQIMVERNSNSTDSTRGEREEREKEREREREREREHYREIKNKKVGALGREGL